MTGRASAWHNSKMPEGQAGPGDGPMTIVAGHSRRNVRYGLSLRSTVVMTLRTTSWSYAIMGKKRGCPICRPVTAVTVDRGRQVVRRLKGGDDPSARRVALHTLRRRSSIYALQVAPLAHNLRVAAAEREAGAAVIDLDIGTACATLGLCLAREHDTDPQNRRDENRGDHTPLTQQVMWPVRIHRYSNTFAFIAQQLLPCPIIKIGNIIPL